MTKTDIWATYESRLPRVSRHIYEHLDEELDNDRLAGVACMSPYHWHRIYRAVHGETLAATVKRLRLQRAAAELAASDRPVPLIARRCGYPNLQSFNRIFKAAYGLPPARYRKEGSHRMFQTIRDKEDWAMYDVTLRTFADMPVMGVAHRGAYMEIGKAFEQLFGTLFSRNLGDPHARMLAIYYDDPESVAESALRSLACVTVAQPTPVDPPLQTALIEAGECAVLLHKGPYADMRFAYRWLYGEWLRNSGREVRDAPVFEIYLNNPREVPPAELLTEICLPLR
ncbi:AraC family transcriptional regulator [Rhizobium cremeum]|uniref:AraC family transcriptional regulator n=1 Tax=Rhizobium cremeum TaxID=2813827 RepID=UPI000DE0FF94